jgi:hypothetical protein
MPVTQYFSLDYGSARELFRTEARRAGATLHAYELPGHRGPNEEPLSIDVARLGPADAERALVVISGTHGVEGFAGSGCQVGFLADRLHEALPGSTCAVLVHALNPHGFAWLRRVNEGGVDLNRNFVDFGKPLPSSAAYEPLHDSLVPADWQGDARRKADLALQAFMQQQGLRAFQAALTGGQYTRPTGLFYGGDRPSWSALRLAEILAERLPASVERIAVLDLHTGLGPRAYGEPILVGRTPADGERARRWYGPEVRDLAADEAVAAQLVGSVADGIAAVAGARELTYVALEFGTRPMLEVLTALRADHWLHSHGRGDPDQGAGIRKQMRQAFYDDTPAWQTAVYGRTADFVFRACRGLGEAHAARS